MLLRIAGAILGMGVACALAMLTLPRASWSGAFHDVAHHGEGRAELWKTARGWELRVRGLRTGQSPDLVVAMVRAADARDNEDAERAGLVIAGKVPPGQGDFVVPLPEGVQPESHRAVAIWNVRYHVNFATAPLR